MEDIDLKCILVLDEHSRIKVKRDITSVSKSGVIVINKLDELSRNMLEQTKVVILLQDYLLKSNALSDLKLFKEMFSLEYYFIGTDRNWLNVMDNYATCFNMDIAMLDYNLLYSVIIGDKGMQSKYINKEDLDETLTFVDRMKLDNSIPEEVREIANLCSTLITNNKALKEVLDSSKSILEYKESKFGAEHATLNDVMDSYEELIKRSALINENLRQYERILTKDVYDIVDVTSSKTRPLIVYFKQYEELIHFNSFLNTLVESIKYQSKYTCKVIRLYDSSRSREVDKLSDRYTILRNEFTNKEFNSEDYIIKVGCHTDVIRLMLENPLGIDILLLVDCKDHNQAITLGHDLIFYCCRNENNIPLFSLNPLNTIVNNSKTSDLSWDTYPNYKKFKHQLDRFNFLSSRPVIKNILSTIEMKMDGGLK